MEPLAQVGQNILLDHNLRDIINYLSKVLFWFRPAMGATRVKMYCDEIVISDAIIRTVKLEEMTLFLDLFYST